MARVAIIKEVPKREVEDQDWSLHFQYCTFNYDENECDNGYRFIWRRPDGTLQPARGQARIPDKKTLLELLDLASAEGWF